MNGGGGVNGGGGEVPQNPGQNENPRNSFDIISDDEIIHMLQFLDVKDQLNLLKVDRRFSPSVRSRLNSLRLIRKLRERTEKFPDEFQIAEKDPSLELFVILLGAVNDEWERTPLFLAAQYGLYDVVDLLLASFDNKIQEKINKPDAEGKTPLYAAVENGNLDIVQYLVAAGADPDIAEPNYDETPIYYAIMKNNLEMVRYLAEEANSNLNHQNRFGETPLGKAAEVGNLDIVRYFVEEQGLDPSKGLGFGHSAFVGAAKSGHLNVVRYIVEKTNPNNNYRWIYDTPIYQAARYGNLDVVKFFVEKTSINMKTIDDILSQLDKVRGDLFRRARSQKTFDYLTEWQAQHSNDTGEQQSLEENPGNQESDAQEIKRFKGGDEKDFDGGGTVDGNFSQGIF